MFYLVPDFSRLPANGWSTFGEAVYAAMGQAFFSLSLGIAAMEIFGSRIGRERSLTARPFRDGALNTVVAILAGPIIFPRAIRTVSPDQGRRCVSDPARGVRGDASWQRGGACLRVHGVRIAVHRHRCVREPGQLVDGQQRAMRSRAVIFNGVLVLVLTLPCALGFNVLSGAILAIGYIQSIEDFIVE